MEGGYCSGLSARREGGLVPVEPAVGANYFQNLASPVPPGLAADAVEGVLPPYTEERIFPGSGSRFASSFGQVLAGRPFLEEERLSYHGGNSAGFFPAGPPCYAAGRL